MSILRTTLALICLLTAQASEIPDLPANSRWLLHADTARLMQGELGRWVTTVTTSRPQIAATLQVVEAMSGFDPRRDLSSLTVAGPDRQPNHALAIARGRFDGKRLTVLLQTNGSYRTMAVDGQTVHTWSDHDGKQQWAWMRDDSMVLFAQDRGVLSAGIATTLGHAPALDLTKAFGPIIGQQAPLFLALAKEIKQTLGQLPPNAAILRQLDSLGLSLSESGGNLQLEAISQVSDAATATHLANLARGLISLAAVNPELSAHPLLKQAVDRTTVNQTGEQLQLQSSMPIATLRSAVDAWLVNHDQAGQ